MAVKRLRAKSSREFDRSLNLIPFISFLSVVVSFLIAGAAWVQLAQIEITLPSQGAAPSQKPPGGEDLTLTIMITTEKLQFAGGGGALPPIPNKEDGSYDLEKLDKTLQEIKKTFPNQRDVILATQSAVQYEKLINVMDMCLKNGYDGLSLAPYTSPEELRAKQKKG